MQFLAVATLVAAALVQGPKDELAALQAKVKASKLGYQAKYQEFKPAFEKFAAEHEGTESALTARLWLLQQTWWLRRSGKMEAAATKIADAILERYPKSKQLAMIGDYHYVLPKNKKAEYFGRILKLTPHDEVKAAMVFATARYTRPKNANALYRKLIAKYGKLPYRATTYADIANALLSPHPKSALAIGQPAPDITGTDVDGHSLKLSDYRGKVIVLDFWGDW